MKFFVHRDNALWAAHSKPAFIPRMDGDEHPWLWKRVPVLLSTWLQVLTHLQGSHEPRARLQDPSQLQISPVLGTQVMNFDLCWPGCVLSSEGMLHCLCSPQHSPADGSFRASPHLALHRHRPRGMGLEFVLLACGEKSFFPSLNGAGGRREPQEHENSSKTAGHEVGSQELDITIPKQCPGTATALSCTDQ